MTQHNTVHESKYSAVSSSIEEIELPKWRGGFQNRNQPRFTEIRFTEPVEINQLDGSSTNDSIISPSQNTALLRSIPTTPPRTLRTLVFTRPLLWSDLTISLASPSPSSSTSTTDPPTTPSPLYHISTHEWAFHLPDMQLFASTPHTPKHQLLGAAHFRFSRNARIGFGTDLASLNGKDTHDGNVAWERLRNVSGCWWGHWGYEFAVPCSDAADGGGRGQVPGRRRFRLERTHAEADGVEGWLGWASFRNYRVVDLDQREDECGQAEEGRVVGVFLSDDLRSFTRVGELRLCEDLGEEVERGVVFALGVVSEKATRRARRRGASGAGSGGGG